MLDYQPDQTREVNITDAASSNSNKISSPIYTVNIDRATPIGRELILSKKSTGGITQTIISKMSYPNTCKNQMVSTKPDFNPNTSKQLEEWFDSGLSNTAR